MQLVELADDDRTVLESAQRSVRSVREWRLIAQERLTEYSQPSMRLPLVTGAYSARGSGAARAVPAAPLAAARTGGGAGRA